MAPRLVLVNAVLLAVAGVFVFELYGELSGARPLAAPPPPRVAQPAAGETGAPTRTAAPRPDQRPLYSVIATKNLFSPSRTEVVASAGAPAGPSVAKPLLHGVVLNDGKNRAYLEDPASKKVFGYAVGDQVAGGRLETIRDDRVVIVRPEGPIEVMLRDPAKPRAAPAPPAPGPQILRPTPLPGAPGAAPVPVPPATAPRPEIQQTPPRTLQSLPPDFLRRRVPAAPGSTAGESGG
jgi:hypothetical protein